VRLAELWGLPKAAEELVKIAASKDYPYTYIYIYIYPELL